MGMITLKMGEVPAVPDEFRCPICGDKLILEIDAWAEDYDGMKAAEDGVHVSCVTEPEIGDPDVTGDQIDEWMNVHFRMPYVEWLPVDRKVYAWLEDNYRFEE